MATSDLSTTYLGMRLASPLVASASPLSEEIDGIRRLEDAGIAAVVLYSLFEEQLARDRAELHDRMTRTTHSHAEALTYLPEPSEWHAGPEEYLEHIRRAKLAVDVPIIASLNGSSAGGWVDYAAKIEDAGADALELNVYAVPASAELTGFEVEEGCLDVVRAVRAAVSIPVAVKLSPYFSSFANVAVRLERAGADALVLFNRFYQPDVDLDALEVVPNLLLSTPQALRLPLRWIAILRGQVRCCLAATSGVHWAHDVLKVLLVGADVAMLCSTLMRHGLDTVRKIEAGMWEWMERHEYESVDQLRGGLSQRNSPDPAAFERAQYVRTLHSYRSWGH
jgi:dihydroorotate dehydrogenase (fumarate)